MSRSSHIENVKTGIRRALPSIASFAKSGANVSRSKLRTESGLNDNDLQLALRESHQGKAPAHVGKANGVKLYDSSAILKPLARWAGVWKYVL